MLGFGDVLLTGLASDGGLYVPEEWPHLSSEVWSEVRPYDAVAVDVMWPFVEGSISRDDFAAMVAASYATFDHPDVCPIVDARRPPPPRALLGPDAGLQGRRAPAGRSPVRPRAVRPRPARHHRRGDIGGHRLGGHRGMRRPRHPRHRRAPPLGSGQRRAAPPDDHGRGTERPQRRRRRHLRRLPGPREGAVRRRRVPDRRALVRHELDQLGTGDGPGRLLRHHGRARLGRCSLRRAHRQLRQRLLRLDRRAHGVADRPARDRLQQQRHPHPLGHRRLADRPSRGPHLQPLDGHPGVVEPRAAALRARRPRRRAHRRRCSIASGASAPSKLLTTDRFQAASLDDDGDPRGHPPGARRHGRARRPAHGRRHRRRPGSPHRRVAHGRAWPPPTRPSSPTPSSGPPGSGPSCRTAWPTCSTGPSASRCCPPRSRPSEPTSSPPSPDDSWRHVAPSSVRGRGWPLPHCAT